MWPLKKALVKVLLPGTLLAVAIVLATKLFLDVEQCPAGYTQQQVDASGCSVGANIGLGLAWLAAILVEAITVAVTIIMLVIWHHSPARQK